MKKVVHVITLLTETMTKSLEILQMFEIDQYNNSIHA